MSVALVSAPPLPQQPPTLMPAPSSPIVLHGRLLRMTTPPPPPSLLLLSGSIGGRDSRRGIPSSPSSALKSSPPASPLTAVLCRPTSPADILAVVRFLAAATVSALATADAARMHRHHPASVALSAAAAAVAESDPSFNPGPNDNGDNDEDAAAAVAVDVDTYGHLAYATVTGDRQEYGFACETSPSYQLWIETLMNAFVEARFGEDGRSVRSMRSAASSRSTMRSRLSARHPYLADPHRGGDFAGGSGTAALSSNGASVVHGPVDDSLSRRSDQRAVPLDHSHGLDRHHRSSPVGRSPLPDGQQEGQEYKAPASVSRRNGPSAKDSKPNNLDEASSVRFRMSAAAREEHSVGGLTDGSVGRAFATKGGAGGSDAPTIANQRNSGLPDDGLTMTTTRDVPVSTQTGLYATAMARVSTVGTVLRASPQPASPSRSRPTTTPASGVASPAPESTVGQGVSTNDAAPSSSARAADEEEPPSGAAPRAPLQKVTLSSLLFSSAASDGSLKARTPKSTSSSARPGWARRSISVALGLGRPAASPSSASSSPARKPRVAADSSAAPPLADASSSVEASLPPQSTEGEPSNHVGTTKAVTDKEFLGGSGAREESTQTSPREVRTLPDDDAAELPPPMVSDSDHQFGSDADDWGKGSGRSRSVTSSSSSSSSSSEDEIGSVPGGGGVRVSFARPSAAAAGASAEGRQSSILFVGGAALARGPPTSRPPASSEGSSDRRRGSRSSGRRWSTASGGGGALRGTGSAASSVSAGRASVGLGVIAELPAAATANNGNVPAAIGTGLLAGHTPPATAAVLGLDGLVAEPKEDVVAEDDGGSTAAVVAVRPYDNDQYEEVGPHPTSPPTGTEPHETSPPQPPNVFKPLPRRPRRAAGPGIGAGYALPGAARAAEPSIGTRGAGAARGRVARLSLAFGPRRAGSGAVGGSAGADTARPPRPWSAVLVSGSNTGAEDDDAITPGPADAVAGGGGVDGDDGEHDGEDERRRRRRAMQLPRPRSAQAAQSQQHQGWLWPAAAAADGGGRRRPSRLATSIAAFTEAWRASGAAASGGSGGGDNSFVGDDEAGVPAARRTTIAEDGAMVREEEDEEEEEKKEAGKEGPSPAAADEHGRVADSEAARGAASSMGGAGRQPKGKDALRGA
ncbi:hypothetical protein HK405_006320 [Cladochytrium tenue]|nr:hypothetical protein HK405_006320 [Cladochytrium tenue]